jgi:non-specific serine/threonine protein kinase
MIMSDAERPEIGYGDAAQSTHCGNPTWSSRTNSPLLEAHVTASTVAQSLREERAFSNATADPHVFPTDTFVGRDRELAALRIGIEGSPGRLVTVLGPAGVGKTRLALEAMRTADEHFPGGALVVRLAAIERPGDIVPEIARAMGILDQAEKLERIVREELSAAPSVLLLDCYEHLTPDANPVVADLLESCPELHIVLTSRRPSGLASEWPVELPPLPLAPDRAGAMSDAARLFVARAQKANERFRLRPADVPVIEELCARYNGLPLAIELMASWVTVLSPRELLEWKPDQLAFRTPAADPRHQSLMDAIAWSFGLLTPDEQALLLRLSAFVGGFSRDLVEKMGRGRSAGAGYPYADGYGVPWMIVGEGGPNPTNQPQNPEIAQELPPLSSEPVFLLAKLIDHNLVYQAGEIDGVPRFDMLESIREFGIIQLEPHGQSAAVRHAHAATMVAFVEATCEGFWQKQYRFWPRERIDADLQNIRSALAWTATLGNDGAELGIRLSGPLWNYWQTRGLISEGRSYIENWIFRPGQKTWCQCGNLPGLAFLCWIQGADARCREVVAAGLAVTEGTTYYAWRAMIYLVMALLEFREGLENIITMMEYVEEAERLFRLGGDNNGLGACYLIYGQVSRLTGDTARALELFEEAQELHAERSYEWGLAAGRYFAAEATRDLAEDDPSRIPEAVALLQEALQRFWVLGDFWGAGGAMSGLACIATMQGVDRQAATYFGAAGVLMGRVGGSLLPSELMTHQEVEAELKARMSEQDWRDAYFAGAATPDRMVEAALADALDLQNQRGGATQNAPRLTRRQMTIVQDLAQGYDIPTIAHRRGRSVSATYELVDRILERFGLNDREDIVPFAVKHGLVSPPQPRLGFIPPN